MRVRHRWLLLSAFVVSVVIVAAILGSRRKIHSGITISFLGYTNLPNKSVRSAVFLVTTKHPSSINVEQWWVEVEGLQDHKAHAIAAPARLLAAQESGGGALASFAADEPLENGRWRVSWRVNHRTLRVTMMFYVAKHRPLWKRWFIPLATHLGSREWSSCVTNSSIWLTNSP
jgi:hypothetical protein